MPPSAYCDAALFRQRTLVLNVLNHLSLSREYKARLVIHRNRRNRPLPPFTTWIRDRVRQMAADGEDVDLMLSTMSRPPFRTIKHYTSMWAYGYHIRADDETGSSHVSFDAGVAAVIMQECRSSRADRNPVDAELTYVGIVHDILVVNYGIREYNVLKCSWIRPNLEGAPTIRRDAHGFWSVKYNARQRQEVEPYVMPNHVQQASTSSTSTGLLRTH